MDVVFGWRSSHACLDRTVDARDRQRVVEELEVWRAAHHVENVNQGFRRQVVVTRQATTIANDIRRRRHTPRCELSLDDFSPAVGGAGSASFQAQRLVLVFGRNVSTIIDAPTEPDRLGDANGPATMSLMARATANAGSKSRAVRDLIANPFVSIEWKPDWGTSTVLDLARTIYDRRAFELMPILSDALLDAGCDHQMIQEHCRCGRPHARGCWVLDVILGRSS